MKNLFDHQWTCTDPATNQHGRQLSDLVFEFHNGNSAEAAAICLKAFTDRQVERTINSYGYTLFDSTAGNQNIHNLYPDNYNWVIAECIYESELEGAVHINPDTPIRS